MNHLTETQLQGLADGTLRGPEGLAAREHCETCAGCDAELSAYGALVRTLSALQDPPPPLDFTASVLAAVEVRETQLSQRRQPPRPVQTEQGQLLRLRLKAHRRQRRVCRALRQPRVVREKRSRRPHWPGV